MTRSLLLVFGAILVLVNPFVINLGVFDTTMQTLKNAMLLFVGGLKFLEQYAEYPSEQVSDITPLNEEEFDFIIVGAGSAGAAIAARLTEDPEFKVLLIEGGGKEDLIKDIPLLCVFLMVDKSIQWSYKNPLKNYCLGYDNKQCGIRTGKSLGGTSAMNFILATRGNRKNYDRWAEETGDESWSYDGMLKYFKKLETADVTLEKINNDYRGFDGPIRIANTNYHTKLVDAFVAAGRELGFSSPNDYNGERQTGFSYIQTNQINGERLTSNRAYLNPIKDRKNLFVTMFSQATKILIDENKTAYGVEFTKNGRTIRVKAKREVILSAGGLGTPKLLMLSGIGPARDLEVLGIPVVQDAPVGENLMDHVTYPALSFSVNVSEGLIITDLLNPANPALPEYLEKRTGVYSTPCLLEGFAYLNVDDPTPDNKDPNMEFMFSTTHMGSFYAVHKFFGINDKYFQESLSKTLYRHSFLLWPVLMQPKSRGKVYLQSTDPSVDPIVDLNFYSDPDDLRVMIKGIRYAMKIAETNAMKKYGARRYRYTIPGCHQYEENSDNFWACALRTYSQTLWHFSGTVKMGSENDTSAVVNSNLQVKNIKNLRVGDASIMPILPVAHLNIPSTAIGEKLADIIKAYWGNNMRKQIIFV